MLDYRVIGRRIAFYRKKQQLTQAKLAELLGVSDVYISQIECGVSRPSLERLSQLSDIFKIDVAVLLSDVCKTHDTYGISEIVETIKHWTPEQKDLLLAMLKCANKNLSE